MKDIQRVPIETHRFTPLMMESLQSGSTNLSISRSPGSPSPLGSPTDQPASMPLAVLEHAISLHLIKTNDEYPSRRPTPDEYLLILSCISALEGPKSSGTRKAMRYARVGDDAKLTARRRYSAKKRLGITMDYDYKALPDYAPPPLVMRADDRNIFRIQWPSKTSLDLSGDPDRALLSESEILLASRLRLPCATYLASDGYLWPWNKLSLLARVSVKYMLNRPVE